MVLGGSVKIVVLGVDVGDVVGVVCIGVVCSVEVVGPIVVVVVVGVVVVGGSVEVVGPAVLVLGGVVGVDGVVVELHSSTHIWVSSSNIGLSSGHTG